MQYDADDTLHARRSSVRGFAGSALIAALVMLYVGFERLGVPDITDGFSRFNWVLVCTLRTGGVAMAAIAVGLWLGIRAALIADAIASALVGTSLVVTGLGLLVTGGGTFPNLLIVAFGAMFLTAGVRRWRDHVDLVHARSAPDRFDAHDRPAPGEPDAVSAPASPPEDPAPPLPAPSPPSDAADHRDSNAAPPAHRATTNETRAEPPPEGYLAAFAARDEVAEDENRPD